MYILWRAATVRPMMCELMGGLAVDSLLRSVGAVPELCRALRQVTLLQCIERTENIVTVLRIPDPTGSVCFWAARIRTLYHQAKIVRTVL
jgi:hypothetical protein